MTLFLLILLVALLIYVFKGILIVQQQQDALNGDIVVAMLEDDHEVTVKRFFKESDYIRLQPENDLLEPIIAKNVIIVGKVIGLFRTMH